MTIFLLFSALAAICALAVPLGADSRETANSREPSDGSFDRDSLWSR